MEKTDKADLAVELYEWSENHLQTDITLDDCVRITIWLEMSSLMSKKLDKFNSKRCNNTVYCRHLRSNGICSVTYKCKFK